MEHYSSIIGRFLIFQCVCQKTLENMLQNYGQTAILTCLLAFAHTYSQPADDLFLA